MPPARPEAPRGPAVQRAENRPEHDHDRNLASLHAGVEAGQRHRHARAVSADAEIAQRTGEPESVHEAERERQLPARRAGIAHQVLDPDEHNRRGDERLDDAGGAATNPRTASDSVTECASVNAVTVVTTLRSRHTPSRSATRNSR